MSGPMDPRRLRSPTGTSLHFLEKKVYQELKALSDSLARQNIVVAVSGGIDSVVLLHVLVALKSRLKYRLSIVHINHGVRGVESDADAKFVGELAKSLNVRLVKKKLPPFKKSPSENTLREGRYKILFGQAKKLHASFVATAHHRDDLLETRLMRLLHGTGAQGLKAMTLVSDEKILRPFIKFTRRDIENYARDKGLEWRNDATNFDTTKFRNWIRRNWIGALKREHPQYIKTLAASLERIVQSENPTKSPPHMRFKRFDLANEKILNYLRYFGEKRVTSRHVEEFKKRLLSPRKKFTFRLAGQEWFVSQDHVEVLAKNR